MKVIGIYKHIGRYKPQIDGYKIFKFNKETREISLATYREDDTFVLGGANKKPNKTNFKYL